MSFKAGGRAVQSGRKTVTFTASRASSIDLTRAFSASAY